MRIIDHFYKNAEDNPEKTAVICENRELSYRDFACFVNKWSHLLQNNGICYGDHIGVLLQDDIEFAILILAAANMGLTLVPLSPASPEHAIINAFKASDVKHIIAHGSIISRLNKDELSFADGLWLSVDEKTGNAASLRDFIEEMPDTPVDNEKVTGEENFILSLTSGSTDCPKPIILTQKNKLDRAMFTANLYSVTENDIVLASTPMYHSLAERLVLLSLIIGGTGVILPHFTPIKWFKCVREHKVSFTIAVSYQLAQIAETLTSPFIPEITSLRCVVSTSALLEPYIKTELLKKLGCKLFECYGTAEIANVTNLVMPDDKNKIKTVGKPIPGADIRIISNNGCLAQPGEMGEISCKTPLLFGGYYNLPELTDACMRDGYFLTGDIGYTDEDGFLYYIDRKKDVIVTGALKVYPADIESAVNELSSVKECAAIPLPDDRLGELVAVAIVPADKESFDQKAVELHCNKRLADYQQPQRYFILDELPKNNIGKPMKSELLKQLLL